MQSKGSLVFLLLLTFWAQFDDALLSPLSSFQSQVPLGNDSDDSDDYESLPFQRLPQKADFSKQIVVGRNAKTADLPLARRGVPPDFNRILPFTPPLLYLFMSLQI